MPTVLAQSNLPKSAAVVVSSETIILRDPNNSILEKYTSDEQKQKSLKSYGIKPATMLSPGENKFIPLPPAPIFYDWIRDDGGAYIATGFLPSGTTKFVIDFKFISGSANYFFGVQSPDFQDSSINTRFGATLRNLSTDTFEARIYWGNNPFKYSSLTPLPKERQTLRIGGGFAQINDETPVAIEAYSPYIKASKEIFIFADNSDNTNFTIGNTYLFSFKIYDEADNLLMSLKPATLNEVPGLYDEVSRSFFENAAESGSFIVGNGDAPLPSLLGGSFDSPSSSSDELA